MNNEKFLLGTPTAYQFCDDNGIAIEMVAKALSKSFLSPPFLGYKESSKLARVQL